MSAPLRHPVTEAGSKVCAQCEEVKPAGEFYVKDKRHRQYPAALQAV